MALNEPPGPMPWPIVGNLPTLLFSASFRREFKHELMMRLYLEYGKIFSIHLGREMVMYVLNDASSIKEAFQRPEFSSVPFIAMNNVSDEKAKGDRIFNGENWTQHRRFALSILKSSFDSKLADEITLLGDVIENTHGKPFDPKGSFVNSTLNIICSIVLGRRFDYDDRDFCVLSEMLFERPKITKKLAAIRQIPIQFAAKILSKNHVKEHTDNLNYVHSFIRRIVEDHKKHSKDSNDCKDFIDLYLTEVKENEDQYDGREINFQENYSENLIDLLLIGGMEGTTHTLTWCFLRLVANPDIQQRIREEITTTCGEDRLPTYSDRSLMPYTEAFLMEVQRLHTMLPLGFPHNATKTTTLEGYTIPEGTIILANLWAVHHDPNVWNEPEEFKLTRFLDKDGKLVNRDEFIPFATGRRSCLGERITKMALFISLTHLVRRFRFTSLAESSTLTFNGVPGFTYTPPEFHVSAMKIK